MKIQCLFIYFFRSLFIYKVREKSVRTYAASVLQCTESGKLHTYKTIGEPGSKSVMSRSFLPVRVGHFRIFVPQRLPLYRYPSFYQSVTINSWQNIDFLFAVGVYIVRRILKISLLVCNLRFNPICMRASRFDVCQQKPRISKIKNIAELLF